MADQTVAVGGCAAYGDITPAASTRPTPAALQYDREQIGGLLGADAFDALGRPRLLGCLLEYMGCKGTPARADCNTRLLNGAGSGTRGGYAHWISKGAAPDFAVHWKPGAPLLVMGNAGQLLQVLMNLIQNAYDAAAGGGAPPQLWIVEQCDADKVRLLLRDNGSGIEPEHFSSLFDPFFTTKPVGDGGKRGQTTVLSAAEIVVCP